MMESQTSSSLIPWKDGNPPIFYRMEDDLEIFIHVLWVAIKNSYLRPDHVRRLCRGTNLRLRGLPQTMVISNNDDLNDMIASRLSGKLNIADLSLEEDLHNPSVISLSPIGLSLVHTLRCITHLTLAIINRITNYPPELTHLTISGIFDYPLTNLPSTLTHLTTGNYFNQPLADLPNLTHLTLKSEFNQPVDRLPSTLLHLSLGNKFNQPLNKLPGILSLRLGDKFNQPVDKLPSTLTHLILGFWFNRPVDRLPPSLTHLTLGNQFNQSIDNLQGINSLSCPPMSVLPSNLTYLIIGGSHDGFIESLPGLSLI